MPQLYFSAKAKILGDRHTLVTVTPRLAFISKSLIKKPENRLVALYAGFDTEAQARRFAAWAQVNWTKTSWDIVVREGDRTRSDWEVKVRKPTHEQLQLLIEKERRNMAKPTEKKEAEAIVMVHPGKADTVITEKSHPNTWQTLQEIEKAPVAPRRMPTRVRGLSID